MNPETKIMAFPSIFFTRQWLRQCLHSRHAPWGDLSSCYPDQGLMEYTGPCSLVPLGATGGAPRDATCRSMLLPRNANNCKCGPYSFLAVQVRVPSSRGIYILLAQLDLQQDEQTGILILLIPLAVNL